MARSLVEEYGYSRDDLELEWTIQVGRAKKRADIAIFRRGARHASQNLRIVVEAKRDTIKPNDRDNGIAQLESYLAASLNAEFGLWVGSEIRAFQKIAKGADFIVEPCLDVPFADGRTHLATDFNALVPATDSLKEVFKRCHNYIAANQGGSKEAAFQEFLKLTFCKVFDERASAKPNFYILPDEQRNQAGQRAVLRRLNGLFDQVGEEYGYIFGRNEQIELQPNVAAYLVGEMQKYSLLETDFDYKGQAYEEIVGANSRGDRGEFFTPRNLCQLAVGMIRVVVGDDRFASMRLLDPACGTGGFLKTYVHILHARLLELYGGRWSDGARVKAQARDRLKQICDRNVFGVDFNPVLVRAAQMNLVMHGDGSSNISHDNSLLPYGEWKDHTREQIRDGNFDVIVTNPPFGKDLAVDDAHILGQFELSTFDSTAARSSMAPQELFIERCHRLLKPRGLLAIVCPDNIVSNPSYKFIRKWIFMRFQVMASVGLPGEMFQPSTGTATTLMLLKKRAAPFLAFEDLLASRPSEPVFMSGPRRIGHDQRGSLIPLRDESGNIVLAESERKRITRNADGSWREEKFIVSEPVPNDDLPTVLTDFSGWYADHRTRL